MLTGAVPSLSGVTLEMLLQAGAATSIPLNVDTGKIG